MSLPKNEPKQLCTQWALKAAIGRVTDWAVQLPKDTLFRTISKGKLQALIWFHAGGMKGLRAYLHPKDLDTLAKRYTYLAFMHLHQVKLTTRVLSALHAEGINTVLLKGAAIAPLVYPDPALRSMNDLDILVSKSHASHAAEILKRIGAVEHELFPTRPASRKTYHERVFQFRPAEQLSLVVELHTGFAQYYRHPIDYDDWIERSIPIENTARRLRDEDQLVHFALHSGRELFMGPLKQLVDAHLWIENRSLCWDTVVETAKSAQAEYMLYELLRLCSTFMATEIPTQVFEACAPPAMSRALFRILHAPETGRLCRDGLQQRVLECLTMLPLLSNSRQRAYFVAKYSSVRLADTLATVPRV